jgi:hypothetical protein
MFPEKPYNMPMPRSQTSSGSELDGCCGEVTQSEVPSLMDSHASSVPQAEAGRGFDKAIRSINRK